MFFLLLVPIILILILLGLLLIKWYMQLYKYRNLNVPGPKPLPIIGNALEFGFKAEDILVNMNKLVDKYGGILKLYVGPNNVTVILTDPKYLKPILNSSTNLKKTRFYDLHTPLLQTGLAVAAVDVWKKNRKNISPAFHYSMFEKYNKVYNLASNNFIRKLKQSVEKPLDMYEFLNLWSLDVIAEISMGVSFKEDYTAATRYLHDLNEVFKIVMERTFSFYKSIDYIFKLLPEYQVQRKYIKYLDDFAGRIISNRIKEREGFNDQDKQKVTILDCVLSSSNNGKDIPLKNLRGEMHMFMVAGHDTITVALSSLLFELSKHPEIQEKILEEVDSILDGQNDFITLQQQNDMMYLDMVVKEGLRLYSPAPFFERCLDSDVEIDGIVLPKGINVNFLVFAMHRSERVYEDPLKFDPERFNPENVAKRDPFAFAPFSQGPRMCIGYKSAMFQLKCMLAKLVREFKFIEADPNFKLQLYSDAVLKSRNGFPVVLRKRK